MSAELIRDAAHVVARKLNRAAAAPFFALALEAPQGDLACASGELAETVIAALGRPPDWAERKAATTLTERCWDALRTAVAGPGPLTEAEMVEAVDEPDNEDEGAAPAAAGKKVAGQ